MITLTITAFVLTITTPGRPAKPVAEARFFRAVRAVEGGTKPGDHGRAVGPYQIHRGYWRDALKVAPALRHHSYAECAREPYGRAVVRAYLTAHAPAAWQRNDWHALAWLHHSGRRGMAQGRGRTYADRVVALMGGGR